MPPEQRIRRSDGGDLAQPVAADANRPSRQTAPVGVGEAEASRAELPADQPVLGNQVHEGVTLAALEPTGEDQEQPLERRGVEHERQLISRHNTSIGWWDTTGAEKQLIKALPKMAKSATSPDLSEALESHLQETQGHIDRIEQIFGALDEKVRGKHCEGIAGIIEEGKALMEEDFDENMMDAALIAAGQRAEHYEMAAYGTLIAWARAMGHTDVVNLLQDTLDEEKAADEKLTELAEGGINQEAADAAHSEGDEEEEEEAPVRSGRGGLATATAGRKSRR
jgi:ferritin-like metal-binding protein YciE